MRKETVTCISLTEGRGDERGGVWEVEMGERRRVYVSTSTGTKQTWNGI